MSSWLTWTAIPRLRKMRTGQVTKCGARQRRPPALLETQCRLPAKAVTGAGKEGQLGVRVSGKIQLEESGGAMLMTSRAHMTPTLIPTAQATNLIKQQRMPQSAA